jgi:hypothetical protein
MTIVRPSSTHCLLRSTRTPGDGEQERLVSVQWAVALGPLYRACRVNQLKGTMVHNSTLCTLHYTTGNSCCARHLVLSHVVDIPFHRATRRCLFMKGVNYYNKSISPAITLIAA